MNQTVRSNRGASPVASDAAHSASFMRAVLGRLALPCALAAAVLLAAGVPFPRWITFAAVGVLLALAVGVAGIIVVLSTG